MFEIEIGGGVLHACLIANPSSYRDSVILETLGLCYLKVFWFHFDIFFSAGAPRCRGNWSKMGPRRFLLPPTTYYFKTKLHRIGLLLVPVDGGLVT